MSQPWFRRLWIIQEFILAKEDPVVHIGRHVARWPDLLYAIKGSQEAAKAVAYKHSETLGTLDEEFARLEHDIFRSIRPLEGLNTMRYEGGRNRSLSWWLAKSSPSQATDDRDKIYGLLGVCQFLVTDPIVADYAKSLLQVLAEATVVEIIEESPGYYLELPFSPHIQSNDIAHKPSWMLGFHRNEFNKTGEVEKLPLHEKKRRNGLVRLSEDCQTLFTQGRYVGTILAVLSCQTIADEISHDTTSIPATLYEFYHRVLKPLNITPQRLSDVLRSIYGLNNNLNDFTTHLLATENEYCPESVKMDDFDAHNNDNLGLGCRCLIVTKEGDLALTWHPDTVGIQAGDIIANLFGYNVPFILRTSKKASVHVMLNAVQFEGHPSFYSYNWMRPEAGHQDEYALV
jgi:hypothetical protein